MHISAGKTDLLRILSTWKHMTTVSFIQTSTGWEEPGFDNICMVQTSKENKKIIKIEPTVNVYMILLTVKLRYK